MQQNNKTKYFLNLFKPLKNYNKVTRRRDLSDKFPVGVVGTCASLAISPSGINSFNTITITDKVENPEYFLLTKKAKQIHRNNAIIKLVN